MEIRKRSSFDKKERSWPLIQHNEYSKILIAEDDEDVLLSYTDILKKVNHRVITAQDGEKCLEIYRKEFLKEESKKQDPDEVSPFDVVVLDYKMPRKDGIEAAKEILALNPHQRIIFASAYVEGTVADSINQLGKIVEVLKKPFELKELIDLIEDKKIFVELEKLNVSVRNLKGINPTHESVKIYLEALKMLQKSGTK